MGVSLIEKNTNQPFTLKFPTYRRLNKCVRNMQRWTFIREECQSNSSDIIDKSIAGMPQSMQRR